MEDLIKQMRGRFSGTGRGGGEESSSSRNQRIPAQKTQSFKGEKRSQNWFQKQFSGQMMSSNHDLNYKTEQVVAVAAAAYAINTVSESNIQDQKRTGMALQPSLTKDKSRKEEKMSSMLKPGVLFDRLSGEGSRKGSESGESKVPLTDATAEKAKRSTPSFKKVLTFADHIGSTSSTKPRSSEMPDLVSSQLESSSTKPELPTIKPVSKTPKSDYPTTKPGTEAKRTENPPAAPEVEAKRQSRARPETEQTKAEAWEKAEMAKIQEKYSRLNSNILDWEDKKKKKARSKLEKAEQSEMEGKRARALKKFRNEMEYVKEVADAAKAQAEARRRNDELKVKEKANIIRTTGEVPRTCFCC